MLLFIGAALASCSKSAVHNALGMVPEEGSRLAFGSAVEKNIITDASLFKNRKIKVRTRNTSGDTAFNLGGFSSRLEDAFTAKGYQPVAQISDDFGLLLDVNVMYSGHISTDLSLQFGFLGGLYGVVRGAQSSSDYGIITGPVAGATIGAILGSFATDDTYIIVAQTSFAEIRGGKKTVGKTITFSRSYDPKWDDEDSADKEERLTARTMRQVVNTGVAVYAGGKSVGQAEIAQHVRQRIVRIMGDII